MRCRACHRQTEIDRARDGAPRTEPQTRPPAADERRGARESRCRRTRWPSVRAPRRRSSPTLPRPPLPGVHAPAQLSPHCRTSSPREGGLHLTQLLCSSALARMNRPFSITMISPAPIGGGTSNAQHCARDIRGVARAGPKMDNAPRLLAGFLLITRGSGRSARKSKGDCAAPLPPSAHAVVSAGRPCPLSRRPAQGRLERVMAATRRLAAILAADVAGYSRLMGADEERTHERLKAHLQELVDPKIKEHRGRIVKNTGDGLLAEFASVVDAVRCAVEIQRGMAEREPEMSEERRIRFRIGVNLGDVIVEDHDIF